MQEKVARIGENMAGSTFGNIFRVTTWGESHGEGIGAVVDGCPAGLCISEEIIQEYLELRKPGQTKYSTPRKENDSVKIFSGVFEGKTTGTPIMLAIMNETQRSKDYSNIADNYRPGHADFTFDAKYGFRDYRGGGRSSGRETAGRVAAGAIAIEALKKLGVEIVAYSSEIGGISCRESVYAGKETVLSEIRKMREESPLRMPDRNASKEAEEALSKASEEHDSMGGIVSCIIRGVPAGIGETVFDKLDASLAKAVMSVGAVKGFEIGEGFNAAGLRGSENNDCFISEAGHVSTVTNHAGGVLGGMSSGEDIVFRAAFKPTPSIFKEQDTVDRSGNNTKLVISGRHDPIIVPRAVVVVEAMAAITVLDLMLINMGARLENVEKFYGKIM